jgi:hypothetical protein
MLCDMPVSKTMNLHSKTIHLSAKEAKNDGELEVKRAMGLGKVSLTVSKVTQHPLQQPLPLAGIFVASCTSGHQMLRSCRWVENVSCT